MGSEMCIRDSIYNALSHYHAFLRYQQQFMIQKQMEQTNYSVQVPQSAGSNPISPPQKSQQKKKEV